VNACLKANERGQVKEQPKNDEDLLTKKEAAIFLKCSTSTIDNYARSGILTRFYLGRSVRFKRKELLQLIK
jgi:excisionase family DNA binding protein